MAELQRHLASSREAFQLVSQMLVTKHDAHAECKQVDMASQRREVQQAVAETRLRAQLARARADLKLVCEQLATSKEHGEARAEEERMAVERLLEDAIEGRWADRRRFKERQARSAVNLSLGLGPSLSLGLSPRPLHLLQAEMRESVSREEFNELAERHRKALGIVATAKAENVALLVPPPAPFHPPSFHSHRSPSPPSSLARTINPLPSRSSLPSSPSPRVQSPPPLHLTSHLLALTP